MALSDLFTRLRQAAFGTSAEGGTDAPIKPTKARWRLISILNPLRDVRHALHRREVQAERPRRPEKICAVIRRQVVKPPAW